ncbi:isoform 2 of ankyrin repeat domain-containing protein 17 [Fagus crenata]
MESALLFIHDAEHCVECAGLYLAALKGDWESPRRICEEFTEHRKRQRPRSCNHYGNTALSYAAATGNVNIARAIVEKTNNLPNLPSSGMKPLYMAALFGHSEMVDCLSELSTTSGWETEEQLKLFVTYASVGLYVQALKMVETNPSLATTKNEDGETALYMLARNPSAFDSGSQPGILRRHINSWMQVKDDQNTKQTPAHQLLREICKFSYKPDDQFYEVCIPQQLIFAAEVGNVQFLIELIRSDPNLLWKIDTKGRTIFHIAVEERHESIFNLLYEIGSLKDLFADYRTEGRNNILHLAAKLSPQHKLNATSGAALQMQQELLWFKEVEKVVHPSFKKMKNDNEETLDVLFAKAHENLRQEGEKWMRKTATSSMVVAALIAQIVFSGQPDNGLNHSSEKSKFVLASSISSAIALFSSSTSLIMFLSILTSRYSIDDYLVSLPTRLMIGVTSLFISIAAMLAAFYASFCSKYLNYHQGSPLIAVLFGLFACLPSLYGLLKYRLLSDIVRSTYCTRSMFQPRQRLLY